MLEHFWHWLARVSGNEGHIAFGEARRLYMSYINSLQKRFDQLDNDDFAAARQAPDIARAEQLYIEAHRQAAQEGRSDNVATVDYQLGLLFHLQGRLGEAQQHLKLAVDSLQSSVAAGHSERSTLSGCYYHLGIIAMREGKRAEAKGLLRESLKIDETDMDISGVWMCKATLEAIDSWPFDTSASAGTTPTQVEDAKAILVAATESTNSSNETSVAPGCDTRSPGSRATAQTNEEASRAQRNVDESAAASTDPDEYDHPISGGTHLIWLLSHSVEANDIYMEELGSQLASGVPRKVSIQRAAFGSDDELQATLPQINSDERLCAAILVLEKEGLVNPEYLRWARLCVDRVAEADDFGLFVGASAAGDELGEYERLCGREGHQLIDELTQTVQFAVAGEQRSALVGPTAGVTAAPVFVPGPREVCEACRSHLQEVDAIRSARFWRALRLSLDAAVGRVAFFGQVAAVLSLCVTAFVFLVLGRSATLSQWIHSHREIAGLLAGMALFLFNTLPTFFILRGPRAMQTLMRRRPHLARLFIIFMLISLGISFLIDHVEMPIAWILLGIGAGAVLDHARRIGFHVRRARVSLLNCLNLVGRPDLPKQLLARGTQIIGHPLFTPLFPAIRPRVFISYARRLPWSENIAQGLHRLLVKQGTVSFLDREGIRAGSGWRSALNRCLTDADVFILVIEAETTTRRWVAGELVAAIAGLSVSGSPRIIILTAPDMDGWSAQQGLPVFRAVLERHPAVADDRTPRVLRITEASLTTVASGLRPAHYETESVIPGEWSLALQLLTLPIGILGPIGELLGLPAAILFYLEYWNRTNVGTFLVDFRLLEVACLVGGYLAGFCARLVPSTAFEVRHRRGRGPTIAHAISCVGITALVILWCRRASPLTTGWAIVLGCAGWYLAELFLQTVKRDSHKFFSDD